MVRSYRPTVAPRGTIERTSKPTGEPTREPTRERRRPDSAPVTGVQGVERMAAARRIGILTGGGDVPGLNSVIKSVTYRATELGYEVIGIRRGWEGLTHVRAERRDDLDPTYVRILDRNNTRAIDRTGGTVLHT